MTEKLYYWAENLENYSADNEKNYDQIIEIKRLNFFIGKNNAGKSRFLRNFFMNNINAYIYQIPLLIQFYSVIDEFKRSNQITLKDNQLYKDFLNQVITIKEIINSNHSDDSKIQQFRYGLEYLYKFNHLQNLQSNTSIQSLIIKFRNQLENSKNFKFDEKFYLPILRGMRPVTNSENKQPYIERTQKDYFKEKDKFNSSNIITGECLYHELKIHLLGEPEQREIIKKYEEKLSQYFFDNETVTLIPKHDQDVINIKIGNDRQFPISELGDGLQQVIILTYEAFITKDKTHAFFIEEPELHMHAGMVRQLMNFYLNETDHYYFFTTHSNHLLDMADESDQVIIQKFVKEPNKKDSTKFDFKIYRCDRDRDLLASLGVKPSSVYLANCTIWVEGITDRLYIT